MGKSVNNLQTKFAAAVRHHAAGHLPEAEAGCREVLRVAPRTVDAMVLLAVVLCLRNDPSLRPEATALLRRALAIRPQDVQALDVLGDVLAVDGDHEAAIHTYERALRIAPGRATLHSKLGTALNATGRHDEAIAAYRRALACDPQSVQIRFNLAVALADARQFEAAAEVYRQVIARRPADPAAHVNLGTVYADLRRFAEAIDSFRAGLRCDAGHVVARLGLATCLQEVGEREPALTILDGLIAQNASLTDAHLVRGKILMAQERFAEAVAAYERLIALYPRCADACNNLGIALKELKRFAEAAAMYRRALVIDPDHLDAHINLGVVLQAQGDLAGAREVYSQALVIAPDSATALSNLGVVLEREGLPDAALALHRRAAALAPDCATVRFNLAVELLRQGDLAAGWDEYEWRWKGGVRTLKAPALSQPLWQGEDLGGRTLLIRAEQGFGDTLQFVRFVGQLAGRNGRVIVTVPGDLKRLLAGIAGVTFFAFDEPLPAFDVHLPMMSLPRILGTRLDTIPAQVPYLAADPASVAAWRERLDAGGVFTVGVVWSGNPDHQYDRQRSIPAASLLPELLVPGVKLFSLQKNTRPADRSIVIGLSHAVGDLAARLNDFGDTAAAVCALDLVISVDTSVVHLAGALGRPVWTLLPFTPDWRWLYGRDDTPWYPTMRLYRQSRPDDWDRVFERLRADLRWQAVRRAAALPVAPRFDIDAALRTAVDSVEAVRAGRNRG